MGRILSARLLSREKKKQFATGIVQGNAADGFEKPSQTPVFMFRWRIQTGGCWENRSWSCWALSVGCRVTRNCWMCFISHACQKKQCLITLCSTSVVMKNWIYEGLMIEGNGRFVTDNSKLFWPLTNCIVGALACTRLMNMCGISSGRIFPEHMVTELHRSIWSLPTALPS